MNKLGPFKLGNLQVWLTPHYLPNVGPQVLVTIEGHGTHTENVTADELRAFGSDCKIASCQAQGLEVKALRQAARRTNHT